MNKRIIRLDDASKLKSLKAMIETLAKYIVAEVYIRQVIEVESTDQVLKAIDAILGNNDKSPNPKES